MEINTPDGDIVVSTDPERFVFDVDRVFKGEAQSRQAVVTASEGASCGLEISGPGPFVVFARLDDDIGLTSGAVEGEMYSSLCSGTRPLAAAALPTSFGTPSPPIMVATGGASPPPASSSNESSGDALWIAAIAGVLVLGAGGVVAHRRNWRNSATQ